MRKCYNLNTPTTRVFVGVMRDMIKTTVTGADKAADALRKALEEFMTDKAVTIGIHEDENARNDPSSGITNAALGAVHEFGSTINHPGGTQYGYNSKSDATKGKVRFQETGTGFMKLGTTKAHKIEIPARPWLYPGVASGNVEYLKIIEQGLKDGDTLDVILQRVGVVAVSKAQQYMTELKTPANAPSTVTRKKSSNPLIDSGVLRSSVDMKIVETMPQEGL